MDEIFKALADPSRRKLLDRLFKRDGQTLSELCEHLPMTRFGTMKHLVLERRWGTLRHSALDAYRAGRDAAPLLSVYWEDYWEDHLDDVRAAYRVRPLERRWLDS